MNPKWLETIDCGQAGVPAEMAAKPDLREAKPHKVLGQTREHLWVSQVTCGIPHCSAA
jgi:hypothetical protein